MTLGSHQTCIGKSQTHLTPRWILDRLGAFDLDPAGCKGWQTAKQIYTPPTNGLIMPWNGRVWLNPPFDRREVGAWIHKMADHGDGILLVHARTETAWFRPIWESADLILFLGKRVKFCLPDGNEQPANSGAPVALAAFGVDNALILAHSGLPGAFVESWRVAA
jgi:hypothetical protein